MSRQTTITRMTPRFRVQLGERDFGEMNLVEARDLRDALNAILFCESSGANAALEVIANHFHKSSAEFKDPSRRENISHPRLFAMALISRAFPSWTQSEIGRIFGRDRTMVTYACAWVKEREDTSPDIRTELFRLLQLIQQSLVSRDSQLRA